MANSLVANYIKTVLGDLTLEATAGNINLVAALSVLLPSDPTVALGAATKQYVDAVATGLIIKDSVRSSTTGTLAATRTGSIITAAGNGAITIDGVSLSVTNRVLVKNGLAAGDTEVKEVTDLTCVIKASYNTGGTDYFDISTHLNTNRYRIYFDITGADTPPAADGRVLTQVNITGDTSATDVATTLSGVLGGLANLGASSAAAVVTATNSTAGDAEDTKGATAVSAAGMTIVTTVQGVSDGSANGVYTVTTVGDAGNPFVLTRAIDADEDAEVRAGLFTFTEEGTVNKDIGFVLITDDPITVNFTAQTFAQFSTHGGDVVGPGVGNSTDEALVRWNGTTGKLVQDSLALLTDAGALSGLTQLDVDNIRINGNSITSTDTNGDINITPDGTGNVIIPGSTLDVGNTRIESNVISTTDTNGALSLNPDGTGAVNIGIVAAARTITIGNGTGATSIVLNAGTGPISIGTNTFVRTITIGNQTGASSVVLAAGTGNIDIGIGAFARMTNIATGGAVQTLTMGSTDTTSTTLIQSGSGGTTILGAIFTGGSITGAVSLGNADSGKTYIVDAGAGYTITLPTAAAGLNYKFVLKVEGSAVTIAATSTHLYGSYSLNGTATPIDAQLKIIFAAPSGLGDRIELYGIDATHWYVSGMTTVDGGITLSAV